MASPREAARGQALRHRRRPVPRSRSEALIKFARRASPPIRVTVLDAVCAYGRERERRDGIGAAG